VKSVLSGLWRLVRPVVGGVGAACLVVALAVIGYLDVLEYWSLSRLYELRGPRPTSAPIVIVTIDESSISEIGKWPFPRALHGELLQKIAEGRPLAIGVDVIFEGPSPGGLTTIWCWPTP
jgi:CHASE2 domain-containing sensor protein